MGELFNLAIFPPLLKQFVMTLALSFIIGLELHSYRRANNRDLGFGTTRTFTLIGILGFVLYLVDDHLWIIGVRVKTQRYKLSNSSSTASFHSDPNYCTLTPIIETAC